MRPNPRSGSQIEIGGWESGNKVLPAPDNLSAGAPGDSIVRVHAVRTGSVERSHLVDDEEFYQLLDRDGIMDDIHLFNGEAAGSGRTCERLVAKMRAGASPAS